MTGCCLEVRAGLLSEVCGSYRRGRDTCGDVDVLITHPDGVSHEGVFIPLLKLMKNKGKVMPLFVSKVEIGAVLFYFRFCNIFFFLVR